MCITDLMCKNSLTSVNWFVARGHDHVSEKPVLRRFYNLFVNVFEKTNNV